MSIQGREVVKGHWQLVEKHREISKPIHNKPLKFMMGHLFNLIALVSHLDWHQNQEIIFSDSQIHSWRQSCCMEWWRTRPPFSWVVWSNALVWGEFWKPIRVWLNLFSLMVFIYIMCVSIGVRICCLFLIRVLCLKHHRQSVRPMVWTRHLDRRASRKSPCLWRNYGNVNEI